MIDAHKHEGEDRAIKQTLFLDEYQHAALKTAIYPGRYTINGLAYTALGLTGEAGEVADKVKKYLRDGASDTPEQRTARGDALAGELGDVLWYLAACANELGYNLSDLATRNLNKLHSRKERGALQGSGDTR